MNQIFFAVLVHRFVFCDSRIHLFVYIAPIKNEVFVDYYGTDDKIITSLEERLFNITDENLKNGVNVELGKEPDDVFLKGPTRYGDLHKKYNWEPVMRRLQVKKTEVVSVIIDKAIIKFHEHVNNTTKSIKCNAVTTDAVVNSITSAWSEDGVPEDKNRYDIDYNFSGMLVMYHNRRTRDKFQNTSLTFGVKKNGYIDIKPGQRVTNRLKGSKVTVLIRIHYAASLIGQVVLNYARVYGRYHFWAPKVSDIMKAAGLKNEIVTSELIEVTYYTNPELEIFDSVTKTPLDVVPFCQLAKLGLICNFSHAQC